jgi:hypothetical protein
VEYDVGCMSVTVKNMLEDTGSAAPIPLVSRRLVQGTPSTRCTVL